MRITTIACLAMASVTAFENPGSQIVPDQLKRGHAPDLKFVPHEIEGTPAVPETKEIVESFRKNASDSDSKASIHVEQLVDYEHKPFKEAETGFFIVG